MNLHKNKLIWLIAFTLLLAGTHIFLLASSEDKIEDKDEKTISEIKNILSTSDNPKEKLNKIKSAIKHETYFWYFIGFLGEALFGSRMVVQWIASEKAKRNVIPATFWYLSLVGSILGLSYAINLRDPVFMLSKGVGFLIYVRNINLLFKEAKTPVN